MLTNTGIAVDNNYKAYRHVKYANVSAQLLEHSFLQILLDQHWLLLTKTFHKMRRLSTSDVDQSRFTLKRAPVCELNMRALKKSFQQWAMTCSRMEVIRLLFR